MWGQIFIGKITALMADSLCRSRNSQSTPSPPESDISTSAHAAKDESNLFWMTLCLRRFILPKKLLGLRDTIWVLLDMVRTCLDIEPPAPEFSKVASLGFLLIVDPSFKHFYCIATAIFVWLLVLF